MASEMTLATMQERLGGAAALAGIVETFYALALNDPALAPVFARVDLDALQRHQEHFLGFVLATDDPDDRRPDATGSRRPGNHPPAVHGDGAASHDSAGSCRHPGANWCARLPGTSSGCAMTSSAAEPPGEGVIVEQPSLLPVHVRMPITVHVQLRLGVALALTAPQRPSTMSVPGSIRHCWSFGDRARHDTPWAPGPAPSSPPDRPGGSRTGCQRRHRVVDAGWCATHHAHGSWGRRQVARCPRGRPRDRCILFRPGLPHRLRLGRRSHLARAHHRRCGWTPSTNRRIVTDSGSNC